MAADVVTTLGINGGSATGLGVGVALIDTGVSPVAGLEDVVFGTDVSSDQTVPALRDLDAFGHGTHLAGLITSDRPDAPGVAPDARLVSIKAGASDGSVETEQVIQAVEWATANRTSHGIDVLVLAYGTEDRDPNAEALVEAVDAAAEAGIVVVVSAGNHGAEAPEVSHPASSHRVIAVGAVEGWQTAEASDDAVAAYSPVGTALRGPDVLAPGTRVVSTGVPGSWLSEANPVADRGRGLFRGTGTSQSAAIVGGAAALLLEVAPSLSPDEVASVLVRTSTAIDGSTAGVIDVEAALAAIGASSVDEGPDLGWDGQRWDGQRWDGQRWDGQRWDGQRWDGQRWDGQRWD
nr:S8 family serine peptidase [Euzebya tangerina]